MLDKIREMTKELNSLKGKTTQMDNTIKKEFQQLSVELDEVVKSTAQQAQGSMNFDPCTKAGSFV